MFLQNECVSLTQVKTFANPLYAIHSIAVSEDELAAMKRFIFKSHNTHVGFDAYGMYLAMLPLQVKASNDTVTFCSKFVTQALQAAGICDVEGENPNIMSPSKLYKLLQQDYEGRAVLGSVPIKEQNLKHRTNSSS